MYAGLKSVSVVGVAAKTGTQFIWINDRQAEKGCFWMINQQ